MWSRSSFIIAFSCRSDENEVCARARVMAILPSGASTRPARMFEAISAPIVMSPAATRKTPQMMMATLTACWTNMLKYMASDDQKRVAELARTEPATASSHFFCSAPSPEMALTVSMPTMDSTRMEWRFDLVICVWLTERASGTCTASVTSSTTGTASNGTSASGPTISHNRPRKMPMKRRSITEVMLVEVKKSRTPSNSRIWLANSPARPDRLDIVASSACSNSAAETFMSTRRPEFSITVARSMRSMKSAPSAIITPAASAHNVGSEL